MTVGTIQKTFLKLSRGEFIHFLSNFTLRVWNGKGCRRKGDGSRGFLANRRSWCWNMIAYDLKLRKQKRSKSCHLFWGFRVRILPLQHWPLSWLNLNNLTENMQRSFLQSIYKTWSLFQYQLFIRETPYSWNHIRSANLWLSLWMLLLDHLHFYEFGCYKKIDLPAFINPSIR